LKIEICSGVKKMTFPVHVSPLNGAFTAVILGAPEMKATGSTREVALEALKTELEQQISSGELVFLEVEPKGLLGLAGKYKDDPTLDDIVSEAYRYRDALKAAEFPE
jgi:hypothetical protein